MPVPAPGHSPQHPQAPAFCGRRSLLQHRGLPETGLTHDERGLPLARERGLHQPGQLRQLSRTPDKTTFE